MKSSRLIIRLMGNAFGLLAVIFCLTVNADVPFTGSISFIGGASLNGPLSSATAFNSIFGPLGSGVPVVLGGSQTGAYASVPNNTPATFSIFTFSPAPVGSFTLWSFNVGPTTYSLDATSVAVAHQDANFLDISGTGMAHITGFADTPATWSITLTGQGSVPVFTFGSSVVAVPEPSAFALILFLAPALWMTKSLRKRAQLS